MRAALGRDISVTRPDRAPTHFLKMLKMGMVALEKRWTLWGCTRDRQGKLDRRRTTQFEGTHKTVSSSRLR